MPKYNPVERAVPYSQVIDLPTITTSDDGAIWYQAGAENVEWVELTFTASATVDVTVVPNDTMTPSITKTVANITGSQVVWALVCGVPRSSPASTGAHDFYVGIQTHLGSGHSTITNGKLTLHGMRRD